MSMDGIDVSGWQPDIDVAAVPCEFVIVKATQGEGFTSKSFAAQAEATLSAGKLLGVYHYVGGGDAVSEADHFCRTVAGYIGRALLCVDWEQGQNDAWGNESYLEALCRRVAELTGVTPMIYASASVFPWGVAKKLGCGAWVAQYANNRETGYQASPWNEGAYSCAIRQYTSCGVLPGYGDHLDLDKAYMDELAWRAFATAGGAVSASAGAASAPSGTTAELAAAVMRGEYGDGADRKRALGDRYSEVQNMVNHVASAPAAQLAREVTGGDYGNGDVRRAVLGDRYDEVQAIVNANAAARSGADEIEALARAVIRGEYGNGEGRKRKLGSKYAAVQRRVNELL